MKVPERIVLDAIRRGKLKKECHEDKMNVQRVEVKECDSRSYCIV